MTESGSFQLPAYLFIGILSSSAARKRASLPEASLWWTKKLTASKLLW